MIANSVFGNPHSENTPSRRSTKAVEHARQAVLEFFGACPDEYAVIFTSNATGALRLVGESYRFTPDTRLALLVDNHNSVLGIRQFASDKGADVELVPLERRELRADTEALHRILDDVPARGGLFAYPAQSNFSGVQHPLAWIETARRQGWHVLLDAAAFVPTSRLGLSQHHPDFVALSFYKMFGWPAGLGRLIARRDALAELRRPWFSGGTVMAASARGKWHAQAKDAAAFEDGTPHFFGLSAVRLGLDYLRSLDYEMIALRLRCLTGWLLENITEMRHDNGRPMCVVYGSESTWKRGATIAFNFLDADGKLVDERLVESDSSERNIALRTGCFCNPGFGETMFGLEPLELEGMRTDAQPDDIEGYLRSLGLSTGGAIRISLGAVTTFADVRTFLDFAASWRNWRPDPAELAALPARVHC